MKPVDQTTHHDPDCGAVGDCFRACIASLLELPADQVPHFFQYAVDPALRDDGEPGIAALQRFLAIDRAHYVEFGLGEHQYPEWAQAIGCHYVLSGLSPRGVPHSVIARAGEIVHDPHPSRAGVVPLDGLFIIGLIVRL